MLEKMQRSQIFSLWLFWLSVAACLRVDWEILSSNLRLCLWAYVAQLFSYRFAFHYGCLAK